MKEPTPNPLRKKESSSRFKTLNYWQRKGLIAVEATPPARHIWHVLWGHADELGVVTLSFSRLANETGYSVRCCQDKIKELIDKMVIKIVSKGNFKGKSNTYALSLIDGPQKQTMEGDSIGTME